MAQVVRSELARVLGLAGPEALDEARGFFDLGLDSLLAVRMLRRLSALVSQPLPTTVTFNYPTVLALAGYLLEQLALDEPPAMPASRTDPALDDLSDADVRAALEGRAAEPARGAARDRRPTREQQMTSDATQTARGATELERQALAALRRMRERLEALESARSEPLAVVGVGCRLPGAPDPNAFWDLLRHGGDAVRVIPPDRWDVSRYAWPGADTEHAGADQQPVYQAGLLDCVDGFDAEFFGIAGREAQLMDPQQRLFLEVAWEALESAGIRPTSLRGTRTGVFVGATTTDYLHMLQQRLSTDQLDAYLVSGNSLNAIAGRVSYTLGLQGPAITMDTACSSSLVALDRACRSVRDGESRLAIAGGVNLILTPEFLVSLARWGMLSPDGRCKTFDASANGFVRAEGCGVVLIKRLTDALADGDRVLALIRGWAVNQDGPSSGFTVPNGLAQVGVMRDALSVAGVPPQAVGYVEAHGTGTALGDPIEMEAIASVYGAGRDKSRPLVVGAVKSNVGHLESAAGVTGVIKTILALQHRQIPPNVHFREPTPHIPWSRIPVHVPTGLQPWEPIDGRRIAGVSAFGFSGTNAHLVLEEAPVGAHPETPRWPAPALLTISARNPAALDALALLYADRLEAEPASNAVKLGLASGAARDHLSLRLAVSGTDPVVLAGTLRASSTGRGGPWLRARPHGWREDRRVSLYWSRCAIRWNGPRARSREPGVSRSAAALRRCHRSTARPLATRPNVGRRRRRRAAQRNPLHAARDVRDRVRAGRTVAKRGCDAHAGLGPLGG